MIELEFSIMSRDARVNEKIQEQLAEFESQTGIRVHLRVMNWEIGRSELTRTALYHHGPDVSEIGTTWVGDMMAMNAVRSFSPGEVETLGPAEDFIPAIWRTCHLYGSRETLAIPWHTETFMIHYRRDFLQQAGIAAETAFGTHADLERTVARLHEWGVPIPIEIPISGLGGNFSLLHYWASWLWAAGTDICTEDGKRTLFAEPKGMQATKEYLGLLRHITPEGLGLLKDNENLKLFRAGKSAMLFSQPNIYNTVNAAAGALPDQGVVDLPQAHFLGGSNLVIWKHAVEEQACVELVRFLTRPETLLALPAQFLSYPPRMSVLTSPGFQTDPTLRLNAQSLLTGRCFPSVPLLGLLESRLIAALAQIAASYTADPSLNPADLAVKVLEPLARKLDVTLSQ